MTRVTADTDVYRAISDPSRRRLLDALVDGPKSFGELHALLPITKGAVSQHLSILARVGLVVVNEDDRASRYELAPAPLHEIDDWLTGYRRFWEEKLDALDAAVQQRMSAARRPTGDTKGTNR